MNLPRAIINLNYFKQNLKYLQTISNDSKLYPVIKANAYGHGFKEIAKTINSMNIDGVCVATVNELKDLIDLNVKYSILHLGNIVFSDIKIYENSNIIATVNSLDDVLKISKMSSVDKLIRVHIKIDTGMSRMGCSINDFDEIFNMCLKVKKIKLEGIYSHLANSDSSDTKLNIKQIKEFEKIKNRINGKINKFKYHLLNSGGLFNFAQNSYDLVRTGLSIYGVSPTGVINKNLKPVMEFNAPIILKKNIIKGSMVGYANTFEAKSDMEIAIAQCGYGDGVPFEFSNEGFVFFKNYKIPIIGRVSMDLICLDISSVKIEINDYVTLWGSIEVNDSRLEKISNKFKRIPYTFLTGVTQRVERVYIND